MSEPSPVLVAEAVQLYEQGHSVSQLVEHFGFAQEAIRLHLLRQGVTFRPAKTPVGVKRSKSGTPGRV